MLLVSLRTLALEVLRASVLDFRFLEPSFFFFFLPPFKLVTLIDPNVLILVPESFDNTLTQSKSDPPPFFFTFF